MRKTYQDYYWYRCIDALLEKIKMEIGSLAFSNKSSLVIAQELLKQPIKNALIVSTTEEGE